MDISYNELGREQNKKIIPAQVKKGVINRLYEESWTADVQIIGSVQTIIRNVPISLGLSTFDIKVGDKCKIETFDETNPDDWVVAFTYGRSKYKAFNGGFLSMNANGSQFAVPHGLGVVPDIYDVNAQVGGGGSGMAATPAKNFWISAAADATNIYITGTSGFGTQTNYWFAAKIE